MNRALSKQKVILMSTVLALSLAPQIHAAVKGAAPTSGGATNQNPVLQSQGQANSAKGTPTWEIQEIERKMDQFNTGKNLTAADKENNSRIKRDILNGAFDLRELSRLALDKNWDKISSAEQNNFVALMTNLLETKAIFSKEQSKTAGKSYTVRYKGDKFQNGQAQARTLTQIFVPKENVTLAIEYRLKKSGDRWKIFDVVVDDASLVENYRYQFNSIISKYGYPELVKRMNDKLLQIKNG